MEIAKLILGYLQVLAWPCVTVFLLIKYRDVIQSLIPRSKVKLTISGVTVETSLETLERSVEESLRGRPISQEQWAWLKRLRNDGRSAYDHTYYDQLRPLRNAGLIREHPEGWLTNSKEIEITTLGKLLLEASERGYGALHGAVATSAPPPDINFEVQHWLRLVEAFRRGPEHNLFMSGRR